MLLVISLHLLVVNLIQFLHLQSVNVVSLLQLFGDLKYFIVFRSVDFSRALKMDGVVGVVTADDVPGTNFFECEGEYIFAVDEVGIHLE